MNREKGKKRAGRALLLLCAGLLFTLGFESAGYQTAVVPISQQFRFGAAGIGRIVSVQYFSMMLFSFLLGRLADRVGKKTVMILAMLLFMLGCGVTLIPGTLGLLSFGIFLAGGGFGAVEGLSNAVLVDHDAARADRALNVTQFAFSIGAFVSPIVCSAAMERGADWRVPFLLCAAAGIPLFAALLRLPFPRAQEVTAPAPAAQSGGQGGTRWLLPLVVSIFFYVGNEIGISYFNGVFFTEVLRRPDCGAAALSLFWLSMGVSRLIFGFVRVDAERVIRVCQLVMAISLALLACTRDVLTALALTAVLGAAAGPVWPLLVSAAVRSCPGASGTMSGVMTLSSGFGGAVVPLLFGALSERVSLGASYLTLSAFSLLGFALMALRARKTRGKPVCLRKR